MWQHNFIVLVIDDNKVLKLKGKDQGEDDHIPSEERAHQPAK
jgi:hypothetical protein